MNIAALIAAVGKAAQLAGSQQPAFKEILKQIKVLLGPADQATLDAALAAAEKKSDEAHANLQNAAKGKEEEEE